MFHRFKISILALITFVLSISISASFAQDTAPLAPEAQTLSSYTLGSGDELKMTVYGEPDLSGVFKVSSTGTIAVPLIGDVALEGLNLSEAESLISSKLSDGYLIAPSVSLEIAEHRPFYIMGEVRKPGRYNYVDDMTALQAVALAGGFTYRARESRVKIKSTNGEEAASPPQTKIRPGDVVMVEERFF